MLGRPLHVGALTHAHEGIANRFFQTVKKQPKLEISIMYIA